MKEMGTDAAKWAAEFARSAKRLPIEEDALDPAPGGFLHAWLANAIEAGRSAGYR